MGDSDMFAKLLILLATLWLAFREAAKRERWREEERERLRERLDREELERREKWMREGRPM